MPSSHDFFDESEISSLHAVCVLDLGGFYHPFVDFLGCVLIVLATPLFGVFCFLLCSLRNASNWMKVKLLPSSSVCCSCFWSCYFLVLTIHLLILFGWNWLFWCFFLFWVFYFIYLFCIKLKSLNKGFVCPHWRDLVFVGNAFCRNISICWYFRSNLSQFLVADGSDYVYNELWRACAGPLVTIPSVGEKVFYFPQGHMEQVFWPFNWIAFWFKQKSSRKYVCYYVVGASNNLYSHLDWCSDKSWWR